MYKSRYSTSSIKQILNASGDIINDNAISVLYTDSRRIANPSGGIFFALNGRRNGHEFVSDAYRAGIRDFVLQQQPQGYFPEANFLLVNDVLLALQMLAAYHRTQFKLEVIGVTGSNGKTIVKEWLYQLLCPDKNVVRNPKSYNSQIGVPLSVWQITERDQTGIFEAGVSTAGEMDRLEAIIQPEIGVLTHIGSAHDEGFADRDEKITEKLKLFKNCRLLVYNYEQMLDYRKQIDTPERFIWSRKFEQADLYVFSEAIISKNYYMRAMYQQKEIECIIPFRDEASVENAIICWATMLALGYSPAVADERLERLTAVSMRLELKNGINDCSVIDDSYNSDVQSLEIALNFLSQQNQHQKKTLILSDIFQSGLQQDVLYHQVADLVNSRGVSKFIGIGSALGEYKELFQVAEKHFYPDTSTFISQLQTPQFRNETILLKGSRSFEFERISRLFVQKAHETVMEINLNALLHNLNFYRSRLSAGVKVMAMVKAFSYGSGTYELANMLQYNKVDYLAVAYADEGVALRQAGITLPLVVLNTEVNAFEKLTAFNLEPVIYSFGLFDEFIRYVQESNIFNYPVHIKIDTGMHRLGFEGYEIETLCDLLQDNPYVRIQTVFSHLVASDANEHDEFTRKQIGIFEKAYTQIEDALGYSVIKHICNTSGVIRWPSAQYDMVRIGIGLYGVDAAIPATEGLLQPIASLKTSISQIKRIPAGDTVGYNRKGIMARDGRIATVRIGYADGYLRAFGNGVGNMLVKGLLAPTIGNISMDMCMIDVTDIEVKEGDEVIVFNDQLRIEELARQIGTIPYEILTNVSQRVKRVYFYE